MPHTPWMADPFMPNTFSVPPVENKVGAFGVFFQDTRWGQVPRKPSHFIVATEVYSPEMAYSTVPVLFFLRIQSMYFAVDSV
jgi:hypothetical protein